MMIGPLLAIIVPLVLTVVIEVLVARAFFNSHYDLKIVALAQCITNPIVNLVLMMCTHFGMVEFILTMIGLEIGAIVAEALIYRKYLSEKNQNKAWVLSIVANIVAFVTGWIIVLLTGIS